MGLDIGFTIYKKEKGKSGKIVLTKEEFPKEREDDTWSCGRCDVNCSWGYGHRDSFTEEGPGTTIKPTFDQELDGYEFKSIRGVVEYPPIILKYVPYEDFKKNVTDAIKEVEKDTLAAKNNLYDQIKGKRETISELRKLQKECDENNEFAFDKWSEEIGQLKDEIAELKSILEHYDTEDYDYLHAKQLKIMLNYLEECQREGHVCIPWYSD